MKTLREFFGLEKFPNQKSDRVPIMIEFPNGTTKHYFSTRIPSLGEQITIFRAGTNPAIYCTVDRIVTMLEDHSNKEFQVRLYVEYGIKSHRKHRDDEEDYYKKNSISEVSGVGIMKP